MLDWARHIARVAAALAGAWPAATAMAVVIVTGDGSGNTTAPLDDPGFANVGAAANGLSGVYLESRWVLTAHHVGEPATFTFDGVPYATVQGSRTRLVTSPGVGADLALVRLQQAPPLPALRVATSPPQIDDVVTLIGNGRTREPTLTCWNSVFTEVSCSQGPPPAYRGYVASGLRALRWGRNQVTATGSDATIPGSGTSRVFETRFDQSGISHESQVANGDSGGAVFIDRAPWELVGILIAQNLVSGSQPGNAAVLGGGTIAVDVSFYADQIDAIVNPPVAIPSASPTALALAVGALLWGARRVRS